MRAFIVVAGLALAGASHAGTPADPIFKVEREFAAYTREHGYAKGFFTYSAPEAITFEPQATKIHEELALAMAKDANESDAPSKLLWRPYRAGIAASGDLAWDMGPWTREGTDKAGWFMTIWRKQDDGMWRWIFDGGAGSDTPANLPPEDAEVFHDVGLTGDVSASDAAAATLKRDALLDTALAKADDSSAYKGFWKAGKIVAAGPAGPPVTADGDVKTMFASRPQGATWVMDYAGASAAGDMTYTVGHVSAADGTYLGHYVRVWCKFGLAVNDWYLVADDYQTAK